MIENDGRFGRIEDDIGQRLPSGKTLQETVIDTAIAHPARLCGGGLSRARMCIIWTSSSILHSNIGLEHSQATIFREEHRPVRD